MKFVFTLFITFFQFFFFILFVCRINSFLRSVTYAICRYSSYLLFTILQITMINLRWVLEKISYLFAKSLHEAVNLNITVGGKQSWGSSKMDLFHSEGSFKGLKLLSFGNLHWMVNWLWVKIRADAYTWIQGAHSMVGCSKSSWQSFRYDDLSSILVWSIYIHLLLSSLFT